jgi:hypothetical protein
MSAVRPQLGARTSAVAALLVVGGGLLIAFLTIRGMLAIAGAHSMMQSPLSELVHQVRVPAPARPPR